MPITNNVKRTVYHFAGGSIRLASSFQNLNKLSELTGTPAFEYITVGMDVADPDMMVERIRNIIFCLQADIEEYTEEQISDWLFGDFMAFFSEDNITELSCVLAAVLGDDLRAKLEAMEANKAAPEEPAIKKKRASSTASKSPTPTS